MKLVGSHDSGFLLSGTVIIASSPNVKSFVFKVDSLGATMWGVRSQDAVESILIEEVAITPSGDVILSGYLRHPSTGD